MTENQGDYESGRKLLDPSELGTKDYWESAYDREIKNHGEDADDEGIIWFDESNAEDTVLKKLEEFGDPAGRALLDRNRCRFLDLGTGNGHMLFALQEDEDEEGSKWLGDMVGVDYSPRSVQLAQQIHRQRYQNVDDDDQVTGAKGQDKSVSDRGKVAFEVWDILTEAPGPWLQEGFDVVLDKGTFDAISLMDRSDDGSINPCDRYREAVTPLVKPGCYLFVTSCNWTKNELIEWLAPEGGHLVLFDEARYPTFTFGGKTGQSVVTLVFQRRKR